MSDMKSKNFSFRASVFSTKLFSIIAATMLLLVADGAIHDAPAPPTQQTQCYPSNLECQNQKLDALEKLAGIKNDPQMSALTLENHQQRLHQLETIAGIIPEREEALDNPDKYEIKVNHYIRLEALERAFANNPPATQQTSVQQDITSTGNSATQTPLPQSVCNMMINGQCNPNTVTAVTAVVATAVIGGITAGVVTAVNNQAQQAQQEQNSKNLWAIVTATAKGAASGGPSCQCNSATQTSPPYCTGAGICTCGTQNCPP